MSWYRAGTVTVTNGSWTVVGANTDFIANASIGDAFQGPDGRAYEIAEIQSGAQIRLINGYQGSTAGGQAYAIQPTSSFSRDLAIAVGQLVGSYAAVRDGVGQGLFPDGAIASPALRFSSDQDTGIARIGDNTFALVTGGKTRAQFSTTSTFVSEAGGYAVYLIAPQGDDSAAISVLNNAGSRELARFGVLGGIAQFASGGDVMLNAGSGRNVIAATAGTPRFFIGTDRMLPAVDGNYNMGDPSLRFNNVFSVNGVSTSSDARLKRWRSCLTDPELAAAREIGASIGIYQMLDAIAAKGEAARLHAGILAQDVERIMAAHGLDALRYGFLCHDTWDATAGQPAQPAVAAVYDDDGKLKSGPVEAVPAIAARPAGDLYSVRYQELSMFILAAQEQRLSALEAKAA